MMQKDIKTASPASLTIRLPQSVRDRAKILAARDGVSLNAWIASAVAEKNAAIDMLDLVAEQNGGQDVRALLNHTGNADLHIPGDKKPRNTG